MSIGIKSRRGVITAIILGLISVVVVFAFALSGRLSRHTQILTVGDRKQVARYFLESYVEDVVRQIATEANKAGSEFYSAFNKPQTSDIELEFSRYKPNTLLNQLRRELGMEFYKTPKIKLENQKALQYPETVQVPEKLRGLEKYGLLAVECSVTFDKKLYSLSVRVPFITAMRMTPVIREFILFCNKTHLEQQRPFGYQDRINLTFTKDSDHPLNVPPAYSAYKGRPWILWPTPGYETDRNRCGRVFLGADDRSIYLNLAGEKNFQGFMSDLWQVFPEWIKVNKANAKFQFQPLFLDKDGKPICLRGIDIPLKFRNHVAKIGILGFCHEICSDDEEGIFANSLRTLQEILGPDPAFNALTAENPQALALASSLKLFGKNGEPADPENPYYGPAREVFGNVYGRFFMITFFEYPSAQGGGQPLPYNADSDFVPPPFSTFNNVSQVTFEPAEPGQRYKDYMSRVVSGGFESQADAADFSMYVNPQSKKSRKPFNFIDFAPADGTRLKGRFDALGPAWFRIDNTKKPGDASLSTIQARIKRAYENQQAFEEATGDGKTKFHVNGVVYVKGDLTLGDITTPNIGGGVVLVENTIELGNITHGIDFTQPEQALMPQLTKKIAELKQNEILTFVSLSGKPIKLVGDKQIGVQLISMNPSVGIPTTQVTWRSPKRPVFCGGIAVDTPYIAERVREFGEAEREPIFFYVPAMADPDPSTAVGIKSFMAGYKLVTTETN